ncbi:hypothetical protein [Amycolatopsis thermoflava]|uniref:hypothetical protein n=1 Tax=Amycolatopsis thermoflava TaxID=84480 RepID=UPI0038154A67
MYFSEYFSINNPEQYEWFNQLLETDTQLFVDPFQMFKEPTSSPWRSAHDEIIDYFQMAFELLAGHHRNPKSLQYKKVLQLMEFPEPEEFGLGFVSVGRRGSGTGKGFAELMVRAMSDAVELGLHDIVHFEELGLLVDRIGRDRISDITCNILKPRIIDYTQKVSQELGIECVELPVKHSVFDEDRLKWTSGRFSLPMNPFTEKPLLLIPWRFLRELPALNAEDWWNYVEPDFRNDLNLRINQKIDKIAIIRRARANTDLVRQWSTESAERPADPYPVDRDPVGLHNWQAKTRDFADEHPIDADKIETEEDLITFVEKIIKEFKHQVEEEGLWALLYNDDTGYPKRETAIQLLFKGVVQSYCKAYSVSLDREVELGRGPVDFILGKDSRVRLLLEIKKMNNGKFWNGLEHQLVSYMESAQCSNGWFLAVRFSDTKSQRERTNKLAARTSYAAQQTGFKIKSTWVDARPKESASNLNAQTEGVRPAPDDPEFEDE